MSHKKRLKDAFRKVPFILNPSFNPEKDFKSKDLPKRLKPNRSGLLPRRPGKQRPTRRRSCT